MKRLLLLIRGESFRLCTNIHNAKFFSYESTPDKQLETLETFNENLLQPFINHGFTVDILISTQKSALQQHLKIIETFTNGNVYYDFYNNKSSQYQNAMHSIKQSLQYLTDNTIGIFITRFDIIYTSNDIPILIDYDKINFPFKHHYRSDVMVGDVMIYLPKKHIDLFINNVKMWGHEMVIELRKKYPNYFHFMKDFPKGKASNPNYYQGENNELYLFMGRVHYDTLPKGTPP